MMLIQLEWKQMLRSRWMQMVGLLFTFVFTTIVVIQQIALPDVEGFSRQTASFLNLLLFLLPLFILAIGSMSVAGDMESRWLSLLKTYPITIRQYILGKFAAFVLAFLLIVVLAFGVVLMLGGFLGGVSLPPIFIVITVLSILIFSALAVLIGALAKTRLYALALALVAWSFFLLLVSYALMALGTVVAGHLLQKITVVVIHLNPVEWLRFGYLVFAGQASVLGPSFFEIVKFYESTAGHFVYVAGTLLWILVPLTLAGLLLNRKGRVA
ncbi:ABC transporter permease subunit [Sporosarcina sp. GW1-11]|uniref:ABC transporter permease n=1 Tax=Sporosarcina sp. GW1-11 TaxID=2899126 RepID=UPI00294CFE30|nr:ABC transporter permease subunit [Sporosarcina sp. GW1-11]MDV6377437.1 ABC transporter permease subunit [Sporosarcina sp. GW1-11]